MIFLQAILILVLCYVLLLWLIPKGFPLYELLRLPLWVSRMEAYPRTKLTKKKIAYGKHFRQYMLYFQPAKAADVRSNIVVYIHGGGWQFGRPEMFRPNAEVLVKRGYHVFMPTHRRIPFFNIMHIREDLVSMLKEIRAIMEAEGISDKNALIGGMSSGANLAGLLTFDHGIFRAAGWERNWLAGSFLLGAPLNLWGMWKSPPLFILAGNRSDEVFSLANPIDHLQAEDDFPVFILHPEKDGLVEYQSVLDFCRKAERIGRRNIEFLTLPDAMHMDAASWCFTDHPSHEVVLGWFAKMEMQ